jgi:hypothetical protein
MILEFGTLVGLNVCWTKGRRTERSSNWRKATSRFPRDILTRGRSSSLCRRYTVGRDHPALKSPGNIKIWIQYQDYRPEFISSRVCTPTKCILQSKRG